MPPTPAAQPSTVPQDDRCREDGQCRGEDPDAEAAEDVRDVVDVGGYPGGPDHAGEREERDREPTPPGEERGGDRRAERRVVRGEPVVRAVGDEGCVAVNDEGSRVGPEVRGDFDADHREDDAQDSDTGKPDLLGPRHLPPDHDGGQRNEEDGIRCHGDDQGVHPRDGAKRCCASAGRVPARHFAHPAVHAMVGS